MVAVVDDGVHAHLGHPSLGFVEEGGEVELVRIRRLLRIPLLLLLLLLPVLLILILILLLLQVVLLVAAAVLLEHFQPRLELVRPGRGALHAAHHHRGGVDQQINFSRELRGIERSRRRVARIDDVRGDGFIPPLLFGVERLEVRTLGPVVLAGVYVSDDESFAASAAFVARFPEVAPVRVDVGDEPVRHAPARRREQAHGGAQRVLARLDRPGAHFHTQRRVHVRSKQNHQRLESHRSVGAHERIVLVLPRNSHRVHARYVVDRLPEKPERHHRRVALLRRGLLERRGEHPSLAAAAGGTSPADDRRALLLVGQVPDTHAPRTNHRRCRLFIPGCRLFIPVERGVERGDRRRLVAAGAREHDWPGRRRA